MADTENQVEQNKPVDGQGNEPTPLELEAREQGWVPKEEYDGDENKWIDADEFVRRKPLFEKINKQSKELKELKQAQDRLIQFNLKTQDREYKRALETLKAQKKEAFTDGDPNRIVEIEDQIDNIKEQHQAFQVEAAREAAQESREEHPEFTAWTNQNTWYTTNNRMKAYADEIGRELAGSGRTPLEVLKEVSKQVREEFPQRFKNANREKPGAVESASTKGSRSNGPVFSAQDRAIAQKFVDQKLFKSVEDYFKEIK